MAGRPIALVVAVFGFGCGQNQTPLSPDDLPVPADCLPNLDGRIDAAELPVALGVAGDYTVSAAGTSVDIAGSADEAGRTVWDFTMESASDVRRQLAAEPIAGKWYAADMPAATFVTPASDPAGFDSAYVVDDGGVRLVGLASRESDPAGGRTLLVYDAPIVVLPYPVEPGRGARSVGTITGGTLNGLPYNGTDTYDVAIDDVGRIELPFVTFTQAHRVRTSVEIEPAAGGVTTSVQQVSFYFECFGELVRAVSADGETDPNFATAAELRRFAL